MAEILFKLSDNTNLYPEKDQLCWKKGMPVEVMDDGHKWIGEECPPKFFVMKFPGVSKEKLQKYLEAYAETTQDEYGIPIVRMIRRRLWKLDLDNLPQAVKNKIMTGTITIKVGTYSGPYDFTWTQVRNYMKNLYSGASAEEL